MDLRAQVRVLRSRWPLVALVVLLVTAGAVAASLLTPRIYTSQATLIVGQSLTAPNPDIAQITASQRLTGTYARLITTRPMLERVIADLGLDTDPDQLRTRISAGVPPESTLLTIAVNDNSPQRAADIANALADALISNSPVIQGTEADIQEFVRADLRELQTQIVQANDELRALLEDEDRTTDEEFRLQSVETRLTSLRTSYAALLSFSRASSANEITLVEPASEARAPSSPHIPFNVALALFLGSLLGIGLAFLADYLDDSLRTREQVERVIGAPVLGSIPVVTGTGAHRPLSMLTTLASPRSPSAEAFRSLRTNLDFTAVDAPVKTILVTSPQQLEGKTTVACNLAVAFAQAGRKTVLVDADLRLPGVHPYFELDQEGGLTDLLRDDGQWVIDVATVTGVPNLQVITSGPVPPNPAELLSSSRMALILRRLAESSDFVVIDSPPVNAVTDASLLARLVDGVLLVVDARQTHQAAARRAAESLRRANARVLGVAVNRDRRGSSEGFGYEESGSEPIGGRQAGVPMMSDAPDTVRRGR